MKIEVVTPSGTHIIFSNRSQYGAVILAKRCYGDDMLRLFLDGKEHEVR